MNIDILVDLDTINRKRFFNTVNLYGRLLYSSLATASQVSTLSEPLNWDQNETFSDAPKSQQQIFPLPNMQICYSWKQTSTEKMISKCIAREKESSTFCLTISQRLYRWWTRLWKAQRLLKKLSGSVKHNPSHVWSDRRGGQGGTDTSICILRHGALNPKGPDRSVTIKTDIHRVYYTEAKFCHTIGKERIRSNSGQKV